MKVGDCFGTLTKLEGRAANSRILSVVTKEPNCEFLKISTSDFISVQEQVQTGASGEGGQKGLADPPAVGLLIRTG